MVKINGFGNYSIDVNGNVFNHKRGIMMKHRLDTKGYYFIGLGHRRNNGIFKQAYIHRLIAEHFIENPNNYKVVHHKNGIRTDNRIFNLEWTTQSRNVKIGFDMGRIPVHGEDSPNHKLTSKSVLDIKKRLNDGEKTATLAKLFNVSVSTVSNIKRYKKWVRLLKENGL